MKWLGEFRSGSKESLFVERCSLQNWKGRGTHLGALIKTNGYFVTSVSILTYELVTKVQFNAASENESQFVEIDMREYLRYSLRQ